MNLLNKMERKLGRYAIPNLPKWMIGTYIIGYILYYMFPQSMIYIMLEPALILQGQVWRLISWIFVPPTTTNIFFVLMIILLLPLGTVTPALSFCVCLLFWRRMCLKLFGGITGDLLGAFVEVSEVIMLLGMVIESACYSWWQVSGQTCLR